MKVKKCDRCGKEIENVEKHMHTLLKVTECDMTTIGHPSTKIDLCGECSDKLYEFIFQKNKERNSTDA